MKKHDNNIDSSEYYDSFDDYFEVTQKNIIDVNNSNEYSDNIDVDNLDWTSPNPSIGEW